MSELEIHDRVFPFVCSNKDCGHEFDEKDFIEVIQLWGLIYLTKKEHMLLGLTCPNCLKTTARKFPIPALDCSIETFTRQIHNLEYFVPFSTKILLETGQIQEDENQSVSKEDSFSLPDGYRLTPDGLEGASGWLKRITDEFPFYIAEGSVPAVIKIENEKSLRAIPRVVQAYSAYRMWERLLTLYMPKQPSQPENYDLLNYMLFQACKWRYEKQRDFGLGDPRSRYFKNIKNEFDTEDFEDFDSDAAITESILPKYIDQITAEYSSVRNAIDFELTHRTKFAAKYARLLYYRDGSSFSRYKEWEKMIPAAHDNLPVGLDEHGMPVFTEAEMVTLHPASTSSTVPPSINQPHGISKIVITDGPKPKAPRPSAICREMVREIAQKIWAENPSITITDMAVRDEISEKAIKKNGDLYVEETIRDWIKDLCPNPRPGRPKKQKKST